MSTPAFATAAAFAASFIDTPLSLYLLTPSAYFDFFIAEAAAAAFRHFRWPPMPPARRWLFRDDAAAIYDVSMP